MFFKCILYRSLLRQDGSILTHRTHYTNPPRLQGLKRYSILLFIFVSVCKGSYIYMYICRQIQKQLMTLVILSYICTWICMQTNSRPTGDVNDPEDPMDPAELANMQTWHLILRVLYCFASMGIAAAAIFYLVIGLYI